MNVNAFATSAEDDSGKANDDVGGEKPLSPNDFLPYLVCIWRLVSRGEQKETPLLVHARGYFLHLLRICLPPIEENNDRSNTLTVYAVDSTMHLLTPEVAINATCRLVVAMYLRMLVLLLFILTCTIVDSVSGI